LKETLVKQQLLILLSALAGPAMAQTTVPAVPARQRVVTLLPGDKCPKPSTPDEIVVCAREDEPYRIPKAFRKTSTAAAQAWGVRADALDEIGRVAGGLPNTCSVIGSGGQTGCTQAMLHQWYLERQEMKREQAAIP
jgi:hypothetical protein